MCDLEPFSEIRSQIYHAINLLLMQCAHVFIYEYVYAYTAVGLVLATLILHLSLIHDHLFLLPEVPAQAPH